MTEESASVMGVVDNTHGAGLERHQRTRMHMALNSAQLTAGQLRSLGTELGVPTSGLIGDLRLIIEGKITEQGRDPRNIQVALSRDADDRSFTLSDHEGVFLTVTPDAERDDSGGSTREHEHVPESENELEVVRIERDELRAEVDTLAQEKAALQEQLEALQQALEASKTRVKEIWRVSCEQVSEFEETTAAKDQEIADLKLRLTGRTADRGSSPTPSVDGSIAELMPPTTRQMRRG